MKGFLWPAGLPHVTPIRGEFLCHRTAPLAGEERILARDGRIPLLWFFQNFPEPLAFAGKIFVHQRLSSLVPDAWLPRTGTYSLAGGGAAPARERLFIGSMEEAQCRLENLDLNSGGLPVSAYIALRTPDSDRHETLLAEYLLRLGAQLGSGIRILSWPELLNRSSFEGTEVFDLGRGILCSDNYLVQLVLSRGGRLCGGDEELTGGTLAPASPFHFLRIHEELCEVRNVSKPASSSYYENLARVKSEPLGSEPWPRWFADWCVDHA